MDNVNSELIVALCGSRYEFLVIQFIDGCTWAIEVLVEGLYSVLVMVKCPLDPSTSHYSSRRCPARTTKSVTKSVLWLAIMCQMPRIFLMGGGFGYFYNFISRQPMLFQVSQPYQRSFDAWYGGPICGRRYDSFFAYERGDISPSAYQSIFVYCFLSRNVSLRPILIESDIELALIIHNQLERTLRRTYELAQSINLGIHLPEELHKSRLPH